MGRSLLLEGLLDRPTLARALRARTAVPVKTVAAAIEGPSLAKTRRPHGP